MKNKKYYFNYAGLGWLEKETYRRLRQFLKDSYEQGPTVVRHYRSYIDKLSQAAAELLNCHEDEIVYLKNTTEGVIIASEILPLRRGDQVLLSESEYSANLIPWLKKGLEGIEVKTVTAPNGRETFERLLNTINVHTKAISISWIQYYDGYMCDLKLLSRICREKGIYLCVDAIQGIGTRKINLREIDLDLLICGGQKHLMGPLGTGFLYVNKECLDKLNHFKVGPRSCLSYDLSAYTLKKTARRFEDGTPNLFGIIALYECFNAINSVGIAKIEEKNLRLLYRLTEILTAAQIKFISYETQGNIVALLTKSPSRLAKLLEQDQIYIKAIRDVARVSFAHKTEEKDFEHLVERITYYSSIM
jgi:selenocysteine lyase/cysteine desulfurase